MQHWVYQLEPHHVSILPCEDPNIPDCLKGKRKLDVPKKTRDMSKWLANASKFND